MMADGGQKVHQQSVTVTISFPLENVSILILKIGLAKKCIYFDFKK
jgi:hypothetical protein